MSLVLVGLAAVLLLVAATRHPQPSTLVLAPPMLFAILLGLRYSAHFRATPANFPAPTPATGLRVTRPSRTRWGSDVREDS
jgi:protein-S-isoprenylcysteine O-methyltransferase Ste14